MRMADRIDSRLRDALAPTRLEVHDDSHQHEGHGGWRPGGETHFRVIVVSPKFEGQGRVARQRLVYGALDAELTERVHALQMITLAPSEDAG
jgi:BolA protein